jgi:hypothetical protein
MSSPVSVSFTLEIALPHGGNAPVFRIGFAPSPGIPLPRIEEANPKGEERQGISVVAEDVGATDTLFEDLPLRECPDPPAKE